MKISYYLNSPLLGDNFVLFFKQKFFCLLDQYYFWSSYFAWFGDGNFQALYNLIIAFASTTYQVLQLWKLFVLNTAIARQPLFLDSHMDD